MIHKCNCLGNLHAYSSKSHWFQLGIFPDKYIELQPKPKKVKGLKEKGYQMHIFFYFTLNQGLQTQIRNKKWTTESLYLVPHQPLIPDPLTYLTNDNLYSVHIWRISWGFGKQPPWLEKMGSSWVHALFLFFEDTSNLSPIIHLSSINMYLNFIFKTVFFWPLTPCQIFDAALWLKSLET